MKVLFLTQVLPYPLDSGPKIRGYYVLRQLATEHEVTLVTFIRTEQEIRQAEHLRDYCKEIRFVPMVRSGLRNAVHMARSLLSSRPFVIERDRSTRMRRLLQEVVSAEAHDVVHADQINMAQYALELPAKRRILDVHNAVWRIVHRLGQGTPWGLRRMLLELEWRKMQRYERGVCSRFDRIVCVSNEDRRALAPAGSEEQRMHVIPITVDTAALPQLERDEGSQCIISVGTMFWPPNVEGLLWFVNLVYPLVRREVPEASLQVIGARPAAEIMRQAQTDSSIEVLGYVEDITPQLSHSAVFIVPLKSGGGMRVKILDAWARGIPIVSTSIGCEGIEKAVHGENVLIGDGPVEFADHVVKLIRSASLSERLVRNGRRTVEASYDWRSVYRTYSRLYQEISLGAEQR
jgi:glycosyltransferase involved in cell wall biosynthesis